MDVHAVFIVFIMLPAAVKTETPKGEVKFWRDKVTLTCPGEGKWFENDTPKTDEELNLKDTYTFIYLDKSRYHCTYDDNDKKDNKYQFYVEGKACKNCFELDATVFLLVIIADLVATVVVMMMVYKCTKRKDSPGSNKTPRAPVTKAGRAPAALSSNYEELNPQTRSLDTYSTVNRMG